MSTDTKEIDTSNLTEKEKEFVKKYGRLPPAPALLQKKDKKYFDSADWALKGAPGNPSGEKEVKQPATNSTIKE